MGLIYKIKRKFEKRCSKCSHRLDCETYAMIEGNLPYQMKEGIVDKGLFIDKDKEMASGCSQYSTKEV